MSLLSRRAGVAILAAAVFVLPFVFLSGVRADSADSGALALSEMETVSVPAEVLAVRDQVAPTGYSGTGARANAPAGPAQDPEVIEMQTFEGTDFPPDGWEVLDVIAQEASTDPTWEWGRVTCEADEGEASAWSAGGGAQGGEFPCWTAYPDDIDTYLMYPGIDTTGAGNIQVQLNLKRQIPMNEAFRMCVLRSGEQQANCFHTTIGDPTQETDWLQLSEPWVFDNTADQTDLMFFLWYVDRDAAGTNKGVLVDNVLIEKLADQPQPTATPPDGTAQPTQPVPAGPSIYMPIQFSNAELDDLEPVKTPEPSRVTGAFGLGLDPQTGELTAEGTAFQYGQMLLCYRVTWDDLPINTAMRYQWYVDDGAIGEGDTDLNPVWSTEAPAGWAGNCVQATNNETQERIPIPLGTYRVDVYVEDIRPDAPVVERSEAVIQEEPPEGATPLPSPTPTVNPEEFDCREAIVNGGFEQGPNVGWSLNTNAVDQDQNPITVAEVIMELESARTGDWLSLMGRGLNIFMELFQTDAIQLPAGDVIHRATLTYYAGLITEEEPDGEHNDIFAPYFVSQAAEGEDPLVEQVPNSGFSEETIAPQRWEQFSFDVTEMLTAREGWETAQLLFLSRQDEEDATTHFLDDATLELCVRRTAGDAGASPAPRDLNGSLRAIPFRGVPNTALLRAAGSVAPVVATDAEVEFAPSTVR